MTLEQLTDWIGRVDVGSPAYGQALAVLTYRQIIVQIKATDAQIEAATAEAMAAEAAVKGTAAAERNANYLWWSVVIAAIAAVASAISAAVAAYSTFNH
jgi:ABC-type glycerol-3-phosphate transport system permease component